MNNFENYPPLPVKPFMELHKELCPAVYEGWAAQIREAQKQMARECWRVLKQEEVSAGVTRCNDPMQYACAVLEERFGPFDE